ncbi:hypothetical protein LCGC14_2100390 [marine sediment metagenome]|uniref:Uncharacterized protein n=1 Tax=marine sediment metagenome TaxID=412755 RepID=A0A0F9GN89_9ZZZZ
MALAVSVIDTSTAPCVQNDVGKMGYQFSPPAASFNVGKYFDDAYTGDLNEVVTKNIAYHQIGIWNVALDSDVTGVGWNIGPIRKLYNGGKGTEIDWKVNTGVSDPIFATLEYTQSENLVHLIQFGAVEKAFSSLETLRDTGYFLPGGELNFTQDLRNNEYYDNWHQTDHTVHNGADRFHQRQIPDGGGADDWYDNLGQSWSRGTDIYDILSPTGSNNTTQYDWAHPGQNL